MSGKGTEANRLGARLEAKSFDTPEETRPFIARGRVDVVTVGRGVLESGWRWSEHAKPIAGHDAWTVGEEPCVFLDFSGMDRYRTKEAR